MACEQYEILHTHRLEIEAEQEKLADNEELKQIEQQIEKTSKGRKDIKRK
ncbi:MAG: hypothetical protein GY777_14875 [Candidatus Brocadiaceae bacterium]|nr:hypothetical protein [Candidatus Brocadiaceae bacterium]